MFDVWCSIVRPFGVLCTSLGGLDLIRFGDGPISRLWCSLAGRSNGCLVLTTVLCWLPSVWCLPCVYPISLSLTISISKLAFALAPCSGISLWLCALASRSGSMLGLSRWLGSYLDAIWGRYAVVGRSSLSNGCVSGLKEVRFVRSSSYGWVWFDQCSMRPMFDVIDVRCNRCSMRSMFDRPFGR
jgi:hypothetical protein